MLVLLSQSCVMRAEFIEQGAIDMDISLALIAL